MKMDNTITMSIQIDIPINRGSSKIYSDIPQVLDLSLEHAIEQIQYILERDGFINTESLLRVLKMRQNPKFPHILFDEMEFWEFFEDNQHRKTNEPEYILRLWLNCAYEQPEVIWGTLKAQERKKLRMLKNEEKEQDTEKEPETDKEEEDNGNNKSDNEHK